MAIQGDIIKHNGVELYRHTSSLAELRGKLFVNKEQRMCVRTSTEENSQVLDSTIYELRQNVFWPEIKKIETGLYEIEYIDHVVYWTEMTNKQIKQCMLFLCDVLEYLNSFGWTLQTHLWNVVLRNGKPFLLDIGDFNIYDPVLQRDSLVSMLRQEASPHAPIPMSDWLVDGESVLSEILSIDLRLDGTKYIKKAKNILASSQTVQQKNYWDNYNKTHYTCRKEILESVDNAKDGPVCDYVKKHAPKTLTDVGCNSGKHSFYAAIQGVNCIGFDYAAKTIDDANSVAASLDLSCSFSYVDIFKSRNSSENRESIQERYRSEMVIAPAILHHIFDQSGKDIKKCVELICGFSTKYAAIEFIPHTDESRNRSVADWFTLDQVVSSLEDLGFHIQEIADSYPSGRQWIFAKKSK